MLVKWEMIALSFSDSMFPPLLEASLVTAIEKTTIWRTVASTVMHYELGVGFGLLPS